MKIQSLTKMVMNLGSHREEHPHSSYDPSGQEQSPHDPPRDEQASSSSQEFSDELEQQLLLQAVQGFQAEYDALGAGLHARLNGVGPGLRVVLQDTQGTTVRQLTGKEFLKLRESSSSLSKGKLLDHKL